MTEIKFDEGMSVKDIIRTAIELNPDIDRASVVNLVVKYRGVAKATATSQVSRVAIWAKDTDGAHRLHSLT